jgi:hypothetical protein
LADAESYIMSKKKSVLVRYGFKETRRFWLLKAFQKPGFQKRAPDRSWIPIQRSSSIEHHHNKCLLHTSSLLGRHKGSSRCEKSKEGKDSLHHGVNCESNRKSGILEVPVPAFKKGLN